MPYRQPDDTPLRTWTLTSAPRWRFVGAAAVLASIGGPALLLAGMQGHSVPTSSWLAGLAMTAAPGLVLAAVWAWAGDGYRVHRGTAEMVLFRDRLEIPCARRAGHDVLALAGLTQRKTLVHSRVNGVEVNQTLMLSLTSGGVTRVLADPLVGSHAALERIAEDVARAQRGEPLTQDAPPPPRAGRPDRADRDALDDRLDAELRG